MTTWRENADWLRKKMMVAIAQGLKGEMEEKIPDAAMWHQLADAMPKPDRGRMNEFKFTCLDADYMVTIARHDSGHGIFFKYLGELDPEFVKAYSESFRREDMTPLTDYLKSSKPLGAKERERLADLLPKGNKMGRPRNVQIRGAADLAWMFYRRLKEINKTSRVADRGCSDDMKLYATRAMVSDYFSHIERLSEEEQERFALQVREFMDKPQTRRGGGEESIVSVPAPWLKDRQKS